VLQKKTKTIMRCPLIPVRMAIIKKITSTVEDVENRELSYTVGRNVS
jgi:hypothetical protein